MLSAIGGTSASYVRSDMSGDSSVKHKGRIKNNYGETASGSNGVSVPVRTSPNANISLWGGGRADLGDQGCRGGTMAGTAGGRVSFKVLHRREDGGSSDSNVLGRSGLWREQWWTHRFWDWVSWCLFHCLDTVLEHKSDLLEEPVSLNLPPDATSMVRAMDMSQGSAS